MRHSLGAVSAVGKSRGVSVYIFGKYPRLCSSDKSGGFSVRQSLRTCFKPNVLSDDVLSRACVLLQGRCRFTALYIGTIVSKTITPLPSGDALDYVSQACISALVDEINRNLEDKEKVGDEHLLQIWQQFLCNGGEADQQLSATLSIYGTLAFTKQLDLTNSGSALVTGGILLDTRTAPGFIHDINEPLFIHAIYRYFGESAVEKLHRYSVNQLTARGHRERGMWLDIVVCTRIISMTLRGASLLSLFPGFDVASLGLSHVPHCKVTQVVGGEGMLNTWVKYILRDPERELIPGLKARNAMVMPEVNAGADAVFAAFYKDKDGDHVVFVSYACAWYDKAVPLKKWKDQISRSVNLDKQFLRRKRSSDETRISKSVLRTRRNDLNGLLKKFSNRIHYVKVAVELPHRAMSRDVAGRLGPRFVHEGVVIINDRNAWQMLGIKEFQSYGVDTRKLDEEKACGEEEKVSEEEVLAEEDEFSDVSDGEDEVSGVSVSKKTCIETIPAPSEAEEEI